MYIAEAALEYLIAILVSGSYLTTLTKHIGISDSLTGIIPSFISLGCVFQLISLFIRRSRMKPLVISFSIANQLLFMFLYVIPGINIGSTAKIVIFVIFIFSAHIKSKNSVSDLPLCRCFNNFKSRTYDFPPLYGFLYRPKILCGNVSKHKYTVAAKLILRNID